MKFSTERVLTEFISSRIGELSMKIQEGKADSEDHAIFGELKKIQDMIRLLED